MLEGLYLYGDGQISFVPGLPDGFKGSYLAGSNTSYFASEAGNIILH